MFSQFPVSRILNYNESKATLLKLSEVNFNLRNEFFQSYPVFVFFLKIYFSIRIFCYQKFHTYNTLSVWLIYSKLKVLNNLTQHSVGLKLLHLETPKFNERGNFLAQKREQCIFLLKKRGKCIFKYTLYLINIFLYFISLYAYIIN